MQNLLGKRLFGALVVSVLASLLVLGSAWAQDAEATPEPDAVGVIDAAMDAASGFSDAAGNIWAQFTQAPTSDVARILMIVGGIVLLVAGWYIYEWVILVAGFLIGGATALAFVPDANTVLAVLAFVVGGLVGAALGALLYYIAVFLIGGYVGILLANGLAVALGLAPVSTLAVIIAFLVGGFILVALSQELLIFFSAVVGAQMIALALNLGFEWQVMLTLVGVVLQLVALRARGESIRRRPLRRPLWRRNAAVN